MMNDEELQAWVERVSMETFGLPFRHRATFNRRLTATGGRYFMKSHNIDISARQLESYGAEETEKIIKHELCHYHLHLLGRGYRHGDADFKEWLAKSGGSQILQAASGQVSPRTAANPIFARLYRLRDGISAQAQGRSAALRMRPLQR